MDDERKDAWGSQRGRRKEGKGSKGSGRPGEKY
jgi:hypothetical protein